MNGISGSILIGRFNNLIKVERNLRDCLQERNPKKKLDECIKAVRVARENLLSPIENFSKKHCEKFGVCSEIVNPTAASLTRSSTSYDGKAINIRSVDQFKIVKHISTVQVENNSGKLSSGHRGNSTFATAGLFATNQRLSEPESAMSTKGGVSGRVGELSAKQKFMAEVPNTSGNYPSWPARKPPASLPPVNMDHFKYDANMTKSHTQNQNSPAFESVVPSDVLVSDSTRAPSSDIKNNTDVAKFCIAAPHESAKLQFLAEMLAPDVVEQSEDPPALPLSMPPTGLLRFSGEDFEGVENILEEANVRSGQELDVGEMRTQLSVSADSGLESIAESEDENTPLNARSNARIEDVTDSSEFTFDDDHFVWDDSYDVPSGEDHFTASDKMVIEGNLFAKHDVSTEDVLKSLQQLSDEVKQLIE